MRRAGLFAAIAAVLAGFTSPASALGDYPLSNRESRSCDDAGMLGSIQSRFRHQVRHVPNLPDVAILSFDRIFENRYIPYSEDNPIARRYCGAVAELSDGSRYDIWYIIEDRAGFAGMGDKVEFCIADFDRWNVYNGRCRTLAAAGH